MACTTVFKITHTFFILTPCYARYQHKRDEYCHILFHWSELYLGCLRTLNYETFGLDFVVFGGVLGVEDELVLAGLQ